MPQVVAQAVAKIDVDETGVKRGFEGIKGHLKEGEGLFSHLGTTIAGVFSAGAIIGGIGLVVGQLKDMVTSGAEANRVTAQTDAVLKSTHGAAGMTAAAVDALSNKYMNLTGIDDDVVKSTENMLLTFTNIGSKGGVFDQATKTALDMSVALGQDTKSSAIQLGKALNDPINGITALQRVGVTFNDTQKNLIKTYMQHGDTAKAQKVILDELNKEFGGSAEAAGKANGGAKILTAQWENMKQTLGQALIPILSKLFTAVEPLIQQFGAWLPGALDKAQAFISKNVMPVVDRLGNWFLKEGLPALQRFGSFIMSNVVPTLMRLNEWFQAHILPIIQTVAQVFINNVLPALNRVWIAVSENLIPAIQHLWEKLSPVLVPVLQLLGWVLQNIVGPALGFAITLIGKLIDFIATVIGKIGDFLGVLGHVKDAIGNAFGGLAHLSLPHFAEGGVMPTGGMAMVGESGPELVYLPAGSRVVNAAETAGMLSGGNIQAGRSGSFSSGSVPSGTPIILKLDGRTIATAILPYVPNAVRNATGSKGI